MSIKCALDFGLKLVGDGTDRVYVINTAVGPFGLSAPPTGVGAAQVAPSFSAGSLVPNGVLDVVSQNGHSVSATILLGVLTITYALGDSLAADEVDVITGLFTFPG